MRPNLVTVEISHSVNSPSLYNSSKYPNKHPLYSAVSETEQNFAPNVTVLRGMEARFVPRLGQIVLVPNSSLNRKILKLIWKKIQICPISNTIKAKLLHHCYIIISKYQGW